MNLLFVLLFAATATGLLAVFVLADYAVHLVRRRWIARGIQQELAAMAGWESRSPDGDGQLVSHGRRHPAGERPLVGSEPADSHSLSLIEARTQRRLRLAVGSSTPKVH